MVENIIDVTCIVINLCGGIFIIKGFVDHDAEEVGFLLLLAKVAILEVFDLLREVHGQIFQLQLRIAFTTI